MVCTDRRGVSSSRPRFSQTHGFSRADEWHKRRKTRTEIEKIGGRTHGASRVRLENLTYLCASFTFLTFTSGKRLQSSSPSEQTAGGHDLAGLGCARRFRLERVPELVDRVRSLNPDHILITGDLTTTALPAEFHAAKAALAGWLHDPVRVTVIPGNHDRYTMRAHRSRRFEHYFGEFTGGRSFPWLRTLSENTAILGLGPNAVGHLARGRMPEGELAHAQRTLDDAPAITRLLVACHYPVVAPAEYHDEFARKPLINAQTVGSWLGTIGPHLYCCGHVHAAWAYRPEGIPDQLCLNAGARSCVTGAAGGRVFSRSISRNVTSLSCTTPGPARVGTETARPGGRFLPVSTPRADGVHSRQSESARYQRRSKPVFGDFGGNSLSGPGQARRNAGNVASAISLQKSGRPRSGSRRGRRVSSPRSKPSRTRSPSRRYPTARTWRHSRSSTEASSSRAEIMAQTQAIL